MAAGCSKDESYSRTTSGQGLKKNEVTKTPADSVLPEKSFFRLFSEAVAAKPRRQREEQEQSNNKILPLSQPTQNAPETYSCDLCGKVFQNKGGRTRHRNKCVKKQEVVPAPTAISTSEKVTSENSINNDVDEDGRIQDTCH